MKNRDPRPVFEALRSHVLPAVEGYWRADAVVTTFLDSRLSTPSNGDRESSCGRSALTAFFGPSAADRVLGTKQESWTNRRTMESALKKLGVSFEKRHGDFPKQGLSLIQWRGGWSGRDFRGSGLLHTHWVAVVEQYVFDVNWPSWLPLHCWEELVARNLMTARNATGWSVLTSYAIQ